MASENYTREERIQLETIWFDHIENKVDLRELQEDIKASVFLSYDDAESYSDIWNCLDFNKLLEDFIHGWARNNVEDFSL